MQGGHQAAAPDDDESDGLDRQSSVDLARKLSAEEREKRQAIEAERDAEETLQRSIDDELTALERQLTGSRGGRPGTAPAALAGAEPEPEPEPEAVAPRPASAGAGAFGGGGKASGGENVIVVCRVRPESAVERRQQQSSPSLLQYGDDGQSVHVMPHGDGGGGANHSFSYRRVFGPAVTQESVYDSVGAPMVDAVLDGFNAAMICYGQTGAGKSYTMLGNEAANALPSDLGLLPRTTQALFDQIRARGGGCLTDVVRASFIEIYMERATDLLVDGSGERVGAAGGGGRRVFSPTGGHGGIGDLVFREDKMKNVYIQGAREVAVSRSNQVDELLHQGLRQRRTAFTGSNAVSSRSHAVFILTLESTDSSRHVTKTSQLYCCDLAGSEKITKTIVTGMSQQEAAQVLKEGQRINTSLLALGNVIAALAKQGNARASHIPYRDSKLTRLLKNSFGGNARTAVVVCCSPSAANVAETLSTLRFGDRSQRITNVARQNVSRSAKELEALLLAAEASLQKTVAAEAVLADENERLRVALRWALLGQGRYSFESVSSGEGDGQGQGRYSAEAMAYARPARHTVGAARSMALIDHDGASNLAADGLALMGIICPISRGVFYDPVTAGTS